MPFILSAISKFYYFLLSTERKTSFPGALQLMLLSVTFPQILHIMFSRKYGIIANLFPLFSQNNRSSSK